MHDGPSFTVLDVELLLDGRRRVLIRKRGGRLIQLVVAAVANDGPSIERLVAHVLTGWPELPDRSLLEGL